MNEPTLEQIITFVTNERPELLPILLKRAYPFLEPVIQQIHETRDGKVEFVVHLRSYRVEKVEFTTRHNWLRDRSLDSNKQT